MNRFLRWHPLLVLVIVTTLTFAGLWVGALETPAALKPVSGLEELQGSLAETPGHTDPGSASGGPICRPPQSLGAVGCHG